MVQGISNDSSLARAALEAALRSQQSAAARIESKVAESLGTAPQAGFEGELVDAVRAGVRSVDAELKASDGLPVELATGAVTDFHDVAAQLKRAELTFKFALEVRNKLIDAYRETMRMSV
jgi:flagellar hook-basal body complex protein FliE